MDRSGSAKCEFNAGWRGSSNVFYHLSQVELWDEEKRLSEVKPFHPMLKVVDRPGNKEEKIMNSNISYLIGKGGYWQVASKFMSGLFYLFAQMGLQKYLDSFLSKFKWPKILKVVLSLYYSVVTSKKKTLNFFHQIALQASKFFSFYPSLVSNV